MRYCLPAASLLTIAAIATSIRAQAPAPPEFARVSGTVVDYSDGHPIRRAKVCFQADTGTWWYADGGYCDETDAQGRFTIRDMLPARYGFNAQRGDYLGLDPPAVGLPSLLALKAGDDLTGIVIRLGRIASISGRVVFEDGEPFLGATIELTNGARAVANENGEYRFGGLPPGDFHVRIAQPDQSNCELSKVHKSRLYVDRDAGHESPPLHVDLGTQATAPDIVMVEVEPHKVSGRVVMESYALQGEWQLQVNNVFAQVGSADGTFNLCGMAPGDYTLVAYGRVNGRSAVGRVSVHLADEDLKNVEVTPQLSASIRGKVVVADNVPLNLSRAGIIPMPETPSLDSVSQPNVRADGTFAGELFEGQYRFSMRALPEGTYLKSALLNGQDVLDIPVAVHNGEDLDGFVFTVSANAAKITGVVQDETGSAVPDALIWLQPDGGHRFPDDRRCTKTTDQNGGFACENVAPGKYRVLAWRKFPDIEVGRNEVASRGTQVEVQEGSSATVVLTVPKQ